MATAEEKARRKQLKDAYLREEQAAMAALMPLDQAQLEALLDAVDEALEADGCDHTLRATDAWAEEHGVDVERLHEGLAAHGGYCDCEVLMNLDAADVFEPVRRSDH